MFFRPAGSALAILRPAIGNCVVASKTISEARWKAAAGRSRILHGGRGLVVRVPQEVERRAQRRLEEAAQREVLHVERVLLVDLPPPAFSRILRKAGPRASQTCSDTNTGL